MTLRPLLTLALSVTLSSSAALAASPDNASDQAQSPQDLSQVMVELTPVMKAHRMAKDFPPLSTSQLQKAQRGSLVTRELPVSGSDVPRLTMATVMPFPVEALYLVLGDLPAQADFIPSLDHSVVLTQEDRGMVREAFQFMGAPYPAQDRGWILRMENNKALYDASNGRVWELGWAMQSEGYASWKAAALEEGGAKGKLPEDLSTDDLAGATTPNFGMGSWLLIPLGPDQTFVQYDSFTDPNVNTTEKAFASVLGTKVQAGMFRSLEPLAKAYADGKHRTSSLLVDMEGHSANGLIDRLRQLRAEY